MSFKFQVLSILTSLIALGALIYSCESGSRIDYINGALPPEEAIQTLSLPPGFKVELVAAEPLIVDPVDMVIDEEGKFFVVELHGYPLNKSGQGRVKLLTDEDGDGVLDKSTIFADNLVWPFGIMKWKNGVIVADAPQILYLEDTDGDGKADIRDTLLTGFAFSNAQMNAGGPIYGLDNWIYLTSEAGGTYQMYSDLFGTLGTDIYFPNQPDAPRLTPQGSGRTVRFNPDTYKLELTSGPTQFSRAFDDWGRHILSNNSNHVYHEVFAAPYLHRNPNLVIPSTIQTLSDHGNQVYSITDNPERQLLTNQGVFTSACGITAYKGGAFPAPYDQSITFVAEPVSNIVHVDVLVDHNTTFRAERIETPTKEFIASTDFWFRPVNMYVGPDGALYVLDYYRQIIEHPEWMSEEAIQSGELYHGGDMGRIYRVTHEDQDTEAWMNGMPLSGANASKLADYLAHPNAWWRLNAQRLLIDRKDTSVREKLVRMILDQDAENTSQQRPDLGRLHALWTLDGLGVLDMATLNVSFTDPIAGVRENAIRIAEKYLTENPELFDALVELKDDADLKVRFQLLCTLGYGNTDKSRAARTDLLFRDIHDPWVQFAALSAAGFKGSDVLKDLLASYSSSNGQFNSLIGRLSELLVTGEEEDFMLQIFQRATSQLLHNRPQGWETTVFHGLARGINQNRSWSDKFHTHKEVLLDIFLDHKDASTRQSALAMLRSIGVSGVLDDNEALRSRLEFMAMDTNLPGGKRAEILQLMNLTRPADAIDFYKQFIQPEEDPSVQLAALDAFNAADGVAMSEFVLANWARLTPQIRQAAVQAHLSSAQQVNLFLDALEEGIVQKSSVDFYRRVRFMTYADDAIKRRARSIFSQKDEGELNEEYKAALTMKGDVEKGRLVFEKNCSICHQIDGKNGKPIGPDLSTVYSWTPEGIVSQVLFPNASITVGYELWQIELVNGDKVQGVIGDESPTAITVRNVGIDDRVISRAEIKSINSLDYSMMPGGWEEIISVDGMADLISFLKTR